MADWREILEALDISTAETSPPPGRSGMWQQLHAVFGRRGFLRLVTDGEFVVVELAPPGDVKGLGEALTRAGWNADSDAIPLQAGRPFPQTKDELRDLWLAIVRLGDAVADDDAEEFAGALLSLAQPASGREDSDRASEPGEDESGGDESGGDESGGDGPAFEAIGTDDAGGDDDERRAPMAAAGFDFLLDVEREWVDVLLGFGSALDADGYTSLQKRLRRNLRAKYDVEVEDVAPHEVPGELAHVPRMRVALRLTPAVSSRSLRVDEVARHAEEYFGTLASLASSGVDPLVFLGVRDAALTGTASRPERPPPATHDLAVEETGPQFEAEDDDEPVVLSVADEPKDGDPLETGRYDDPRLQGADANTSLVDVVLRHPGYSDRNIGQVLSILLSLDYARCLELARLAPTVIAWGVARDRAKTMKTVIEGAGGKVYLAAPGEFGEA